MFLLEQYCHDNSEVAESSLRGQNEHMAYVVMIPG